MAADDDEGTPRAGVFRPSRFCWDGLDKHAAERLWDELVRWVQWFRHRYEVLEKVPPCWYRHPRMVEELTALMTAHRAAYTQLHAVGRTGLPYWSDMAAWHAYYLRPFLAATADMSTRSCSAHQCKLIVFDEQPLPADLGEWIDNDLAARREPTPEPEPDPGPESTGAAEPAIAPSQMYDLVAAGKARTADVDAGEPEGWFNLDGRWWSLDTDTTMFVPESSA
ncbi:hypothetical protein [Gordonia humi]|uniref:DUF4913 domain-containing protein n=1 Tax=Gordonia humi TaxID=686429 RepID=A0A840EYC4_9ACTN|nr:hypothetical protein [Gordonia humi]MBB4138075.1 hypothetical protein [Gordonia humi]